MFGLYGNIKLQPRYRSVTTTRASFWYFPYRPRCRRSIPSYVNIFYCVVLWAPLYMGQSSWYRSPTLSGVKIFTVLPLQSTKAVYNRILDLRIANPQIIINFAAFLEEHRYFEEAFKVRTYSDSCREISIVETYIEDLRSDHIVILLWAGGKDV